jgi:hypothetical protein
VIEAARGTGVLVRVRPGVQEAADDVGVARLKTGEVGQAGGTHGKVDGKQNFAGIIITRVECRWVRRVHMGTVSEQKPNNFRLIRNDGDAEGGFEE